MEIFLSSKADRQLQKFPRAMHRLLISRIEDLADNPFPMHIKKLAGREGWRLRVGDYRIIYTIDRRRQELAILSVAHRKEAYR